MTINISGNVNYYLKKESWTMKEHDEWIKYLVSLHNRTETIELLEMYYERGYRYVAREDDCFLLLFGNKPKKFVKDGFWGYTDQDLKQENVISAQPLKNKDITEISFRDRSATLIHDFIKKEV